jgi:hypothetical protein
MAIGAARRALYGATEVAHQNGGSGAAERLMRSCDDLR